MSETPTEIRVLLVDDHTVVRRGLNMVLSLEPGLVVVGEAANGQEAVEQVAQCKPQVVLMDLLMPVMNGVDAIRKIKADHPEVEVVALTSVLEDRLVVAAVEAGAAGYLLKETGPDELFEAIRAASRGEVRLDPKAQKRLVREVRTPEMRESLTGRETDTLRLIAKGLSNKEIATALDVSEVTVKTHVSSILSKLHLSSRTQAALFALKEGLVGLEP
ncbi:MAG: response regulator transcription factor [Trueperaceae bacterium]|nr:MAG: response regulator transcription factor [Trueperaceae bacterium]